MGNSSENQHLSRDIYTITRLNREVRAVLEGSFPSLWVQGEISNLAQPGSGHIYFSLKDKHAQVRCAMFKNRKRHLRFLPENGQAILVQANVGLYEGRGEFQLIIEQMEPAGTGALQQAFEKLKQKLNQDGLFDNKHKQALPGFPETIGIITSPTGAAVQDILNVLKRRYPIAEVIIYPVPVQGEGAAAKIAQALDLANQRAECDVLILARGGGSLEDLWSFNDELVARAIFDSSLPIISGVGHEIDFTIADFVADHRAPTPSAAAELVSPNIEEIKSRLESLSSKLTVYIANFLATYQNTVAVLLKRLPQPGHTLQNMAQRLDDLSIRLTHATGNQITLQGSRLNELAGVVRGHSPMQRLKAHRDKSVYLNKQLINHFNHTLNGMKERVRFLSHALNTVSPQSTLDRGYAIVTTSETDQVIQDANALQPGQIITTRFAKGRIHSSVEKVIKHD